MTTAIFDNDILTISKSGVALSAEMNELEAKDLRDQLLARYPVEPEATPVSGPARGDAGMGDFELIETSVSEREAEPCAEQVEAVARILFEESWTHRPAPISFDEFKTMSKDKYTDERIEGFRHRARMILDAARKAVM